MRKTRGYYFHLHETTSSGVANQEEGKKGCPGIEIKGRNKPGRRKEDIVYAWLLNSKGSQGKEEGKGRGVLRAGRMKKKSFVESGAGNAKYPTSGRGPGWGTPRFSPVKRQRKGKGGC